METRHVINEFCVREGVPWVRSSALGSTGEVMPIVPGGTACLACLFDHVDGRKLRTCETSGILKETGERAGELAVSRAMDILYGEVSPGIVRFDLSTEDFRELEVSRREDCRVCGRGSFEYLGGERGSVTSRVCGEGKFQVNPREMVDLEKVERSLRSLGDVERNEHLLRFDGEERFTLFRDGRAIIEAGEERMARSIYSRFVGL